jgi:tetratricopeptide (TPR) repeat protein
MYAAFEARGPEQVRLAKKALELSADCADAYVLLAENAGTLREATDLYRQGVAAGERALGQETFQEYAGHFWGFLETRPYMRARLGLAQCLWDGGRRDEAVDHFREMLRLNPGDNQGVRYRLAANLLEFGQDDEVQQLLDSYPEDGSADWAYARALLAFRREGDSTHARSLLARATEINPFAPGYLLGDDPIPEQLPGYVTRGGADEAVSLAVGTMSAWRAAPGAITWLRKTAPAKEPERTGPPTDPWNDLKEELDDLPHDPEAVWLADIRRFPTEVPMGEETVRPWATILLNTTEHDLLYLDLHASRPQDGQLWGCLLDAMLEPMSGTSHIPRRILVTTKKRLRAWKARLESIGVECQYCDDPSEIDEFVRVTARQLSVTTDKSPAGPTAPVSDLSELPQEFGESWQADVRRLPTWIRSDDGSNVRPWVVMVTNATKDLILSCDIADDQPDLQAVWMKLTESMSAPPVSQPHRPVEVQVRSEDHRRYLEPALSEIDIACVVSDRLDQLDSAFEDMARHIADGPKVPALVEAPGVGPDQIGSYFEAAAEYFRHAPWSQAPGDTPIRVECEKFRSGPWHAFVMGQSGMTLGLALYDLAQSGMKPLDQLLGDEQSARQASGLSVMFDEPFGMAFPDLEAAEQFGWPVATPEAWPCAVRVNPGRALRAPLAWEIELLEGCLRAIPTFLAGGQPGPQTVSVRVASGDLEITLSWANMSA